MFNSVGALGIAHRTIFTFNKHSYQHGELPIHWGRSHRRASIAEGLRPTSARIFIRQIEHTRLVCWTQYEANIREYDILSLLFEFLCTILHVPYTAAAIVACHLVEISSKLWWLRGVCWTLSLPARNRMWCAIRNSMLCTSAYFLCWGSWLSFLLDDSIERSWDIICLTRLDRFFCYCRSIVDI